LLALYVEERPALALGPVLSRSAPALVLALVLANVIAAPLLLGPRACGNTSLREILERADSGVPRDPYIADKVVVMVNPPAVPLASYIPIERAVKGVPRPRALRWPGTSTTEMELERPDAMTLRVRPRGGFLLNSADRLLRSPRRPLRAGEGVDLGDVRIRVRETTPDGRPAEITARFSVPLEDESLRWRCWGDIGYTSCAPPDIGETIRLPAADYFKVVFGIPLPFSARLEAGGKSTAEGRNTRENE
jgi:hypothetical protein